ncbi:hypothetical protein D3C86_1202440 [compost metagenome]
MNLRPEPQGQSALRLVRSQPTGRASTGSLERSSPVSMPSGFWAIGLAISFSPVPGFRWISWNSGISMAGGASKRNSTVISQRVTLWRRSCSSVSNRLKASVLYSFSGSRWP